MILLMLVPTVFSVETTMTSLPGGQDYWLHNSWEGENSVLQYGKVYQGESKYWLETLDVNYNGAACVINESDLVDYNLQLDYENESSLIPINWTHNTISGATYPFNTTTRELSVNTPSSGYWYTDGRIAGLELGTRYTITFQAKATGINITGAYMQLRGLDGAYSLSEAFATVSYPLKEVDGWVTYQYDYTPADADDLSVIMYVGKMTQPGNITLRNISMTKNKYCAPFFEVADWDFREES